jgi:hypothetical protein
VSLLDALRARWRAWRAPRPASSGGDSHLESAADSLRALLDDRSVPAAVREALAADYEQVEAMLAKLERGDVHLAVFGRVSVGKSALANALLGRDEFEVGVLHGTTRHGAIRSWREVGHAAVHVIDTPGINELGGDERERLAHEIAARSDLVLFVCDGDLTDSELGALRLVAAEQRPVLLVLNKADRYAAGERVQLLERLRAHARGLLPAANVVAAAARPTPQRVLRTLADGHEIEREEARAPELDALLERVIAILEAEGKTLAALNAAMFASRLSDEVGARVAAARAELAERVIRGYCLAKGLAVALNPIPVADLLAAATLDVGLVVHLGRVHGQPITRGEAGRLLATIMGALAALMGAVWGMHLVSSALKGASAGLSTVLTAGAQGALAWYATLVVGRAAQRYCAQGRSWGEQGPKRVIEEILATLDRDSVLREARDEILRRLRRAA